MDDRIELCRWHINDCADLATALEEAETRVSEEGDEAYLSFVLWNDKAECANVSVARLLKVPMTDGSAAYEMELHS